MRSLFTLIAVTLFMSTASADVCFWQRDVRGFHPESSTSLLVEASFGEDYRLTTEHCQDLLWADAIAFDSFLGSQVCNFDHLLIVDQFSGKVTERCRIRNIEKAQ